MYHSLKHLGSPDSFLWMMLKKPLCFLKQKSHLGAESPGLFASHQITPAHISPHLSQSVLHRPLMDKERTALPVTADVAALVSHTFIRCKNLFEWMLVLVIYTFNFLLIYKNVNMELRNFIILAVTVYNKGFNQLLSVKMEHCFSTFTEYFYYALFISWIIYCIVSSTDLFTLGSMSQTGPQKKKKSIDLLMRSGYWSDVISWVLWCKK